MPRELLDNYQTHFFQPSQSNLTGSDYDGAPSLIPAAPPAPAFYYAPGYEAAVSRAKMGDEKAIPGAKLAGDDNDNSNNNGLITSYAVLRA